jgi:hypothetical protein
MKSPGGTQGAASPQNGALGAVKPLFAAIGVELSPAVVQEIGDKITPTAAPTTVGIQQAAPRSFISWKLAPLAPAPIHRSGR